MLFLWQIFFWTFCPFYAFSFLRINVLCPSVAVLVGHSVAQFLCGNISRGDGYYALFRQFIPKSCVTMSKKLILRRYTLGLEGFLITHLRHLEVDINTHPSLEASQDISWITGVLGDIEEIRQFKRVPTYESEMVEDFTKRKESLIVERDLHEEDLVDHELLIADCDEMLNQIRTGNLSPELWEILYNLDYESN